MNKPPEHYDGGAMLLHWSVTVLILCASLSSFFLSTTFSDFAATSIRAFHNLTGTLALGLVIVWFGWRARHAELPKLTTIGIGERRFMEVINSIMNVLLVLVPLTGILHLYAIGKTMGNTHNVLGKLLLAIALLHSFHALWHHFGKRDDLVRRMLPWKSK
jgi:cytochrome b561